ncbi:MAG TPA: thiamine phosphate synthase [Myxococcota bacterium]|jgi:thiamine-phosphate pyrophosphorylase
MQRVPLDFSGLHVLADDDARWKHDPVVQARAACAGGARVVQLRAKHSVDSRALDWAREIRALTRAAGVAFVMNDRVDLALACEADAVHLGQDDLPPAEVRRIAPRLAIGRSTHDAAQLARALAEPIDYVAYGPVFGTASKHTGYDARGLAALREIASHCAPLPLVAIGGIDARSCASVRAAGAHGVAVISAVANAADPLAAVRELVAAFGPAR